jgi:hypothetical protein
MAIVDVEPMTAQATVILMVKVFSRKRRELLKHRLGDQNFIDFEGILNRTARMGSRNQTFTKPAFMVQFVF